MLVIKLPLQVDKDRFSSRSLRRGQGHF